MPIAILLKKFRHVDAAGCLVDLGQTRVALRSTGIQSVSGDRSLPAIVSSLFICVLVAEVKKLHAMLIGFLDEGLDPQLDFVAVFKALMLVHARVIVLHFLSLLSLELFQKLFFVLPDLPLEQLQAVSIGGFVI